MKGFKDTKVGMQYVKDFSFPPAQGFSGSAGKSNVKGYMRGGAVKASNNASGKANAARAKAEPVTAAMKGGAVRRPAATGKHVGGPNPSSEYPPSQARQKMPKNVHAKGGKADYMEGGTVGVTTKRGPKSRRPKNTMTAAAKGGSVHDKLYAAGGEMGYKRGGQVKKTDTSSEFVQKSKAQATMDDGVQPARKGRNQAEIEAGGTKRLKSGLKKGGKVRKAKGGKVAPPSVSTLGGGAAADAARAMRTREERVKSTVNEALAGQRKSQNASPRPKPRVHDVAPKKSSPRKIYREDKEGVPTFTDVPKTGKRVGKRGAAR